MLTAATEELDNINDAVEEIFGQLDLAGNLLKNAVGIITCEPEFVDAGVVRVLCERLPFDTVGITTQGSAVPGHYGSELLTIAVLTSDDVSFAAVFSDPITPDNIEASINDAFKRARSAYSGVPSLILAYLPLLLNISNATILNTINSIAEGIPIFGSVSCDGTIHFTFCKTIYNGNALPDTMALVMMYGEVKPRFFITSVPYSSLKKQYAFITESESGTVRKVNNISFADFLKNMQLADSLIGTNPTIPFIVKNNDGNVPMARALYSVLPEGYGVFGGDMPVGAKISLCSVDYNGILETAEDTLTQLLADKNSCALIYTCLSRALILSPRPNAEMEKTAEIIGDKIPYQICYSGGEYCPVENAENILVNHVHNFTFIVCAF
jgi:hypothetical protein